MDRRASWTRNTGRYVGGALILGSRHPQPCTACRDASGWMDLQSPLLAQGTVRCSESILSSVREDTYTESISLGAHPEELELPQPHRPEGDLQSNPRGTQRSGQVSRALITPMQSKDGSKLDPELTHSHRQERARASCPADRFRGGAVDVDGVTRWCVLAGFRTGARRDTPGQVYGFRARTERVIRVELRGAALQFSAGDADGTVSALVWSRGSGREGLVAGGAAAADPAS